MKQQAKDAAGTVQDKAKEMTDQAKQQTAQMTEEAKRKAGEYTEQAKDQARSKAEEQKDRAASRLEGVASGLREAGDEWHDRDQDTMARYTEAAADQVEQFSEYLKTHSTGDLLHEVERFARRQPEIFMAGSLAAGFLLGRFIKSSGQRSSNERDYGSNYASNRDYGRQSGQAYGHRYPSTGDTGEQRWRRNVGTEPYERSYGRSYGAGTQAQTPETHYHTGSEGEERTEFTYGQTAGTTGRTGTNVTQTNEARTTETEAHHSDSHEREKSNEKEVK